MPSLKDLKNRIGSVKSTQKITKAMKMVAAAKLRRAQDAVVSTRPYADKLVTMIEHLAERVDHERHGLLRQPESPTRAAVLVIAGDRGLCGSYNTNVLKSAYRFMRERADRYESLDLRVVGRKANDFFTRRPEFTIASYERGVFGSSARESAHRLAEQYCERFVSGELDELFVVYTRFRSVIAQDVVIDRVLPLRRVTASEADDAAATAEAAPELHAMVDYIYEPSPDAILDTILPLAVSIQIQRAILESEASEQGARMSAMDNATSNAGDMISNLTLQYNRARQASITKELIEIVSGAEAV